MSVTLIKFHHPRRHILITFFPCTSYSFTLEGRQGDVWEQTERQHGRGFIDPTMHKEPIRRDYTPHVCDQVAMAKLDQSAQVLSTYPYISIQRPQFLT
jgi:hypothetical protein